MSDNKIDLQVFKELAEALGRDEKDLAEVVYQACNNELSNTVIPRPSPNGRKWDDPEYRAEWEKYSTEHSRLQEQIESDFGYKLLDSDSSGEGGGEYCYGVFTLKGKTYQANYNYYSHEGHSYDWIVDTLVEVVPKEVLQTIYVRV